MGPFQFTLFDAPLLTWMVLSPLLGVLSLCAVSSERPQTARVVATFSAAITFVLSLVMMAGFKRGLPGFQLKEQYDWIPSLGVKFALGIDGMSLWLILLTTLLTLLVLASSASVTKKVRSYLACMLILEVGMLGAFVALDALTFYMFWELMLTPMYFLIGVWGGKRRFYAAIKFVLFTAAGSLLMLVAIVYLGYLEYQQHGAFSFLLSDWYRLRFTVQQELWLFAAFALAFAIKVPVFPLHTWLPDAHVEAPTGGSVILAGVLLKMGLYGLIRFGPVFSLATVLSAPLFAVLGVIGIIYGALVAWVQTDIKKLVAYSSVSHLGFCVLGYASMTIQGMQGSILQMINHGISTSALFFIVGVLYERKHTRLIADYGGLSRKTPVLAAVFMIFTLSSVGLPLTNGFVGEFLTLLGGFSYNRFLGACAVSGVVLGAVYMLSLYRRVMFGALDTEKNGDLDDLTPREMVIFAPLLVLVFAIGLFPQIILGDLESASRNYLNMQKLYAYKRKPERESRIARLLPQDTVRDAPAVNAEPAYAAPVAVAEVPLQATDIAPELIDIPEPEFPPEPEPAVVSQEKENPAPRVAAAGKQQKARKEIAAKSAAKKGRSIKRKR